MIPKQLPPIQIIKPPEWLAKSQCYEHERSIKRERAYTIIFQKN
jgi:hypothetical protein